MPISALKKEISILFSLEAVASKVEAENWKNTLFSATVGIQGIGKIHYFLIQSEYKWISNNL